MNAFNCPNCNQPLESPDELIGQTFECPACNKMIQVPKSHLNKESQIIQQADSKCPGCGKQMPVSAILCVNCGYNRQSGQCVSSGTEKVEIKKVFDIMNHHFLLIQDGIVVMEPRPIINIISFLVLVIILGCAMFAIALLTLKATGSGRYGAIAAFIFLSISVPIGTVFGNMRSKKLLGNKTCSEIKDMGIFVPIARIPEICVYGEGTNFTLKLPTTEGYSFLRDTTGNNNQSDKWQINSLKNAVVKIFGVEFTVK